MHRIFGRAKAEAPAPPPPDVNAHVQNLTGREQQLTTQIADIDRQLLQLKQQMAGKPPAAVQHLRQQAMFLLKRKTMYTQQRSQTQTRAFQLEQANFAIQTVQGAHEQVAAMKYTAEQLKTAQKGLDLGELEDLYDGVEDGMADVEDLNEVLSRDFMVGEGVNEAALDAELAGLDAELASLPSAPIPAGAAPAAVPAGGGIDAELAALDGGWSMPAGPAVPAGMPAQQQRPAAVPVSAGGAASSYAGGRY